MKRTIFILALTIISFSSYGQNSKKFCYGINYSSLDSCFNGEWENSEFSKVENSMMILGKEDIHLVYKGNVNNYSVLSFEQNTKGEFIYLISDIKNPSERRQLKLVIEDLNKVYISLLSNDAENKPSTRITMISSYLKPEVTPDI
jgi:hypothetical protein